MKSISGESLDANMSNLKDFSERVKNQNILKVIRHNNFFTSFGAKKLNVFEIEAEEEDLEEQAKILISSEEDPDLRANLYEYWKVSSQKSTFNNHKFVQDLLIKNFSFL